MDVKKTGQTVSKIVGSRRIRVTASRVAAAGIQKPNEGATRSSGELLKDRLEGTDFKRGAS